MGCSVESELAHLAWRKQEEELIEPSPPMLSDLKRDLYGQLGVLDERDGVAQRATFIVAPQRLIRLVNVSRDPGEVLRVLADLQEQHFSGAG
jgi:alkyl hydroperoxide reductase subunit AhpC